MVARQNIQHIIMRLISAARTIDSDELIDQVVDALESMEDSERKVEPKYVVRRTIKRLNSTGAIDVDASGNQSILRLTKKGSQKLRRSSLSHRQSILPTNWDGHWRMVILDFESDDKRSRDAVRYILKKANFACIKSSVWITPFDYAGFIAEMKYNMGLTHEVMFVITEHIDPEIETDLLHQFSLKK